MYHWPRILACAVCGFAGNPSGGRGKLSGMKPHPRKIQWVKFHGFFLQMMFTMMITAKFLYQNSCNGYQPKKGLARWERGGKERGRAGVEGLVAGEDDGGGLVLDDALPQPHQVRPDPRRPAVRPAAEGAPTLRAFGDLGSRGPKADRAAMHWCPGRSRCVVGRRVWGTGWGLCCRSVGGHAWYDWCAWVVLCVNRAESGEGLVGRAY